MTRAHHRSSVLLTLGALLVFGANFRWGVGALAWLAPVPWLHFLRLRPRWGSRALFVAVACATWIATTLKIVTEPVPLLAALPMGVGAGLFSALGYLVGDWLRRRSTGVWATLAFPSAVVVTERLQAFTVLSSWGAMAHTQLENPALLQLASLGGVAAVSFAVAWVAQGVETVLAGVAADDPRRELAHAAPAGLVLLLALGWGSIRQSSALREVSFRVATIGTKATFGASLPLPDVAERAGLVDLLLADSGRATDMGARLLVWTEAAALVMPGDEELRFRARLAQFTRARGVDLVAAYVVPVAPDRPTPYRNEYRWFGSDGTERQVYQKHHPAPGEPGLVGTGPTGPIEVDAVRGSGAICYDYDYPDVPTSHARLGVDVVALPSSDWRGIDPEHTQMARVRAIQGGFSLVRATRFGTSAIFDPLGRTRAWHSSFEGGDRVLVADVPRRHLRTIYALTGDVLPWVALGFLGLLGLGWLFRGRPNLAP
jgi:apolipoprotein N-acyltransferase